ncbi:MAG: DUF502 domain-containing protein [candidate division WOR-3 bacterium]
MVSQPFWQKVRSSLKKEYVKQDLITGLIVLGPVVLTLYIVFTVISIFGNFFAQLLILLPFITQIPSIVKTLIGATVGFVVVYLTGLSVRLFFGLELENFFTKMMNRIPVVKTIYNAIRDLVRFISPTSEKKFSSSKIVVFRIGKSGTYLLGFVTSDKPIESNGKKFYTIFMPTTPNPTTGFFFLVEEEDLSFVDIDYEDAIKLIMTAGIIMPEGGESLRDGLARLLKKVNEESSGQIP